MHKFFLKKTSKKGEHRIFQNYKKMVENVFRVVLRTSCINKYTTTIYRDFSFPGHTALVHQVGPQAQVHQENYEIYKSLLFITIQSHKKKSTSVNCGKNIFL